MYWINRWLGRVAPLNTIQTARLKAWQALPKSNFQADTEQTRWVVVDVETSGLNLSKDKLIAIGAVAVLNGKVNLNDSFEVVLQQPQASSKANILIHGIGGSAQTNGKLPADALLDFLGFLGNSPLVAFHVTFDQTMLCRAIRSFLGLNFKHDWVDLAYVAPGLHPEQRLHSLDDWLNYFHIQNDARHNALADAVSTAQLLLALNKVAAQQHIDTYAGLQTVEKNQRWVSWQG
jgi:DNA polymerase-3 subunit epsilon